MSTQQTQSNGVGAAPPKKPPQPAVASRMGLDKLVKGKQEQPRRVLLYGPEGIGKTTFGANAPSPIVLGAEDGTSQLDVTRFPKPEGWQDVLDAIRTLTTEKHEFKTLVVDTLDAIEPMLWSYLVARDHTAKNQLKDIEDYGYGKGYAKALDEWRVFLANLERLRAAKGMHIIFLAHSLIKPFKNPEGDDFDRYEMKLHTKAGGLLKEWCDAVLFANYETYAHKDEKTKRVRGVSTGARMVFTQRTAAYDAKNRYSLPEALPLSWSDFDAAATAGAVATPAALREEIERKAKEIGGELEKTILETMAKAGDDTQRLALINNRANAKLAEKGTEN